MKDINIKVNINFNKLLFLIGFLSTSSCIAKNYKNIDDLIYDQPKDSQPSPSAIVNNNIIPKKEIKDINIVKDKNGNFKLSWEILSEYDIKNKNPGKNLNKVINKNISIKGYMLPLDYSKKSIKEFLLLPYIPSCYHVPPPPPNMIINVKVNKKRGIKISYYPVKVSGKLNVTKLKTTKDPYMMNGIYSLTAQSVEELKN